MHSTLLLSALLAPGDILAVFPDFLPEAAVPTERSLHRLPALNCVPDRLCQDLHLWHVERGHSAAVSSSPGPAHLL